ncbi:MAG TPA: hypothetical protein VFZ97_03225 [Acidimicrobiales bacterium]
MTADDLHDSLLASDSDQRSRALNLLREATFLVDWLLSHETALDLAEASQAMHRAMVALTA